MSIFFLFNSQSLRQCQAEPNLHLTVSHQHLVAGVGLARVEKQAYFEGSKNYCKAKTICFSSGTAGSREKKIVSTLGLNRQQPIGHYATVLIATRLFMSWELTNNVTVCHGFSEDSSMKGTDTP